MTKHRRENWTPREGLDRPSPERQARGVYRLVDTEDAGISHAFDQASCPIDRLHHEGVIDSHQRDAAIKFEELARSMRGGPGQRSCLNMEPIGYDADYDGDPEAEQEWKQVRKELAPSFFKVVDAVCYQHRNVAPGTNMMRLKVGLQHLVVYWGLK